MLIKRNAKLREGTGPPTHPHGRSFHTPKFEERTQEDTLAKERWARRKAWDLARKLYKDQGNLDQHRATFFSPCEVWRLPAPSTIKPKKREFVVDSRTSMHILSVKDFNAAELETVRFSRTPYESHHGKCGSANERRSNSACQRYGSIRDSTAPRGHTASSIIWATLQRSWIFP